jgi:hypothetical protein
MEEEETLETEAEDVSLEQDTALPSAEAVDIVDDQPDISEGIQLTEDQEKELVNLVERNWEESDAARDKWMRDKEEGLNLYWGLIKAKQFPFKGCANLHVPLIRTIADTLHSNLMGSLDFSKPVSASPVGPEDVPKARKAEKLLNWQFTTQVDYFDLVDRIATACLVFGHADVKVRYSIEKEAGEKVFDGIRVDVLPPERFLVPADATDADVQKMDYVIQEIPMTKSDVKKRILAGKWRDLSDEDLDKFADGASKTDREVDKMLENIREFYSGVNADHHGQKSGKYGTVLEWHGLFDINDDGVEEKITVTFLKDCRKVMRIGRSARRRPFVRIRFSPIPDKPTGESIPDLLKPVNNELNTLHNQRVDSVTITNIPFFFFDPVAGFNPNEITLAPGVGIPTNGPPTQAVYFPSLNTSRPEMYREEEMLFQYAERMLGAGANTQGVLQTKRVTATEVAAVDRRAGIRFLTLFNRIKKGLRDVFMLAFEMDKDNMPADLQIRVNGVDGGPVFDTIRQSEIRGQFDLVINGNSIVDAQAEKQEMIAAYNLGMMNPLIMRDENAIYELTRDAYQALGVKRIDAYLRKPADTIPKSPEEEHNLFLQEEEVKPNVAENIQDHLKKHAAIINGKEFELFSPKAKALLLKHYNDTVRMDNILQQLKKVAELQAVNQQLMGIQTMPMMGNGAPPNGSPGMAAEAPARPQIPNRPA